MSLPVSVGDAILLAKISYNLGKAFTSGRKSAPAEFVEIQDLLYTLSNALELVAREYAPHNSVPECLNALSLSHDIGAEWQSTRRVDNDTIVSHCVRKCRVTLEHLQALVKKYTELDPNSGPNVSKRWKDEIKQNWKKVIWTSEGAGLERLKIALTAHINGINLAIAAHNKAQGDLTLKEVETINKKLDNIYELFAGNLRNRRATSVANEETLSLFIPKQRRLAFSVWLDADKRSGRHLRCPRASFKSKWLDSTPETNRRMRVFECHCEHACDNSDKPCARAQIHQPMLDLFLLPVSLFVRKAGESSEREWRVYVGSTESNSPVALVIDNVPPTMTSTFETTINKLSALQARRHSTIRSNTTMVSAVRDDKSHAMMILDFKPDVFDLCNTVQSVTFETNGRRFTTPRIETLQFLHYKCIRDDDLFLDASPNEPLDAFRPLPHMDLAMHHLDPITDEPIHTWTIQVGQETRVRQAVNPREVALFNVFCTASSHGSSTEPKSEPGITCAIVVLSLVNIDSAGKMLSLIRSMQRELRISYLRCQRWTEQIMFCRELSDIVWKERLFEQARLDVVLDPAKAHYRLIVSSVCGSLTLCVELPEDFIAQVGAGDRLTNENLPIWLVEIAEVGTHVSRSYGAGHAAAMGSLLSGAREALRAES